jgi:unsaturated rhamnogalacturonyl hydrolase
MNRSVFLQQAELEQGMDKLWNKLHGTGEHDDLNHWEWVQGVALYGVVKAHEETRQDRYGIFLQQWTADNVHQLRHGSVNWVAPANALLSVYQEIGDPKLLQQCREVADWCVHEALRTTNGGFAHVWGPGAGGLEDYKHQLWIDTLFMAGIYMLRIGLFERNKAYTEEALRQFDIHIGCQFDPGSGLISHGYHCLDQTPLGEHWGRGNGWAAVSVIELLSLMQGQPYATASYEEVFKQQMESVYRLRLKDGMLRTLLDVEESYLETSASALFAYAALKGYRLGVLEEKYRSWGEQITLEILYSHLAEDGTVLHASGGTDCQDAAGYLRVPYASRQYSTGVVMMLFSEAIAHHCKK